MIEKVIIWTVAIVLVIAVITAMWRLSHDFFKNLLGSIVNLVIGLLVIYIGWKIIWAAAPPGENKEVYRYIIQKYYDPVEDSIPHRTTDVGMYREDTRR